MSESIHQSKDRATGRSAGTAGSNGNQEDQIVEIIQRLTQDQLTTYQETSTGSQGPTSTSVMGILVGEGLQMANKAGSKIDFAAIAKQFQFMGSGKSEKVDLKLLGDFVADMIKNGAAAAVACEKSSEGAPAAEESIEAKSKAIRGLRNIEEDLRTAYGGTRGTNPLTQSQKREIQ